MNSNLYSFFEHLFYKEIDKNDKSTRYGKAYPDNKYTKDDFLNLHNHDAHQDAEDYFNKLKKEKQIEKIKDFIHVRKLIIKDYEETNRQMESFLKTF